MTDMTLNEKIMMLDFQKVLPTTVFNSHEHARRRYRDNVTISSFMAIAHFGTEILKPE